MKSITNKTRILKKRVKIFMGDIDLQKNQNELTAI